MNALAAVFAGLALFITGMNIMGDGLQTASGAGLRRTLERATRRRSSGLATGAVLGLLIQSSAGTVMLASFISAGLLTFVQSIPVMLGINIGTTLSMLVISFHLGDACWLAIAAGLLLKAIHPEGRPGASGLSIFGFGLIFLGLNIMSDAIRPFRGELANLLIFTDGSTLSGLLTGVLLATLITAIIQSSGAVIGMVFALISAGVITGLHQAWPIILGANIGTCATALLGSIGAPAAARRSAVAHLTFNLFSAAAGIAAAPLVFRYIPHLVPVSASAPPAALHQALIHQCAVANTLKMLFTALLALPFTRLLAGVVSTITPDRGTPPPPSLLNSELLTTPEDALQAVLQELCRLTGICRESLHGQSRLYLMHDARQAAFSKASEETLDTLKPAMHDYLKVIAHGPLSRRQAILLTLLYTGIDHLERISDHIARMAEISAMQHRQPAARFTPATLDVFLELNHKGCTVLTRLQQALASSPENHQHAAAQVLVAREQYMLSAVSEEAQVAKDLSSGRIAPVAALYRSAYLSHLNRIVKHARALAMDAEASDFHIKTRKLGRSAAH